jgi:hypothetical protein
LEGKSDPTLLKGQRQTSAKPVPVSHITNLHHHHHTGVLSATALGILNTKTALQIPVMPFSAVRGVVMENIPISHESSSCGMSADSIIHFDRFIYTTIAAISGNSNFPINVQCFGYILQAPPHFIS